MHISTCALVGTTWKKSMRLQGTINGRLVLLLVDSRSNDNFISSNVVKFLHPVARVPIIVVNSAV
jgi:hypothetical protein